MTSHNMNHRFPRRAVAMVLCLGAASGSHAASLTGSGYSENFDSMGTSGTVLPSGWSMLTGNAGTANNTWTTTIPANGTNSVTSMVTVVAPLTATSAPTTTNNNGFNAARLPSATSDRVAATSPTTVSGAGLNLRLTNNTGFTLNGFTLSFDTVRFTSASSANQLPGYWLFYSVNNGASWTNVSALNPTLATVPNSVGVTAATGSIFFATPVAVGADFQLRWIDDNATQTSPDQIIGLNNVVIANPVPVPAALPLLLSALGGLGLLGRRRA